MRMGFYSEGGYQSERETLAPVTGNTCKNESNSTVKQKIENNLNVHLEETKEANCG